MRLEYMGFYDYMEEHGLNFVKKILRCEVMQDKVYDVGFTFKDFEKNRYEPRKTKGA